MSRGIASLLARPAPWRPATAAASSIMRAPALVLHNRGLAKMNKADKKKLEAAVASTEVAVNQEDVVRGLNIFKDQKEEVKVKADSEYPDWVFTLHIPRASLDDLQAAYQENPESLTHSDAQRMLKLWNRKRIKAHNDEKRKK